MNSPFYGYDNADELDRDVMYMKNLYPQNMKKIQTEVEDECDKLEYDGSCMFDELPDCTNLGVIVDSIYTRISSVSMENEEVQAESLNMENTSIWEHPRQMGWSYRPSDNWNPGRPPYTPPCGPGRNCPPPKPDYRPDGRPDYLRNLISVMLYNEMTHRRRRYRSRKQWL